MSACMWQVAQERNVDQYDKLAEFITLVTEIVPELLRYKQKTQLILGLRARVSEWGYWDFMWASFPVLLSVERKQFKKWKGECQLGLWWLHQIVQMITGLLLACKAHWDNLLGYTNKLELTQSNEKWLQNNPSTMGRPLAAWFSRLNC